MEGETQGWSSTEHMLLFLGQVCILEKDLVTLICGLISWFSLRSRDDVVPEGPPPAHHVPNIPETPLTSPARVVSDTLIVTNVAIFMLQLVFPGITMAGIKVNDLIDAGEYWRLLTPAFLHGSPAHLLLNMLSLHSLGTVCEWTCGRKRFLMIYLYAAVAGNIFSYFGDDTPSLGASGAIFGLAGALIVYFARNKVLYKNRGSATVVRLSITVLLNFGIGLLLPDIDEWGHLGGFLGGAMLAFLLGPAYELCYIKGRDGVWLVDVPIIQTFACPPRKVFKL
jgi:uridine nucleosidase